MYLIECVMSPENIETREGYVSFADTTEERITLTALVKALSRFNKRCDLNIFTKCGGVFCALDTGRALTYAKAEYRNAKGDQIKNAELWDLLLEHLERHEWKISKEDHSYMSYMASELKKRIKR